MTTASHLLYFYRATELVTVKHGNDERAILRAAGALLAERSSDQPIAGLLAADGKSTVLQTLRDGRNETYAYLPYGYDTRLPSAMPLLGFNGETLLARHLGYALGQGYRLFNPSRMRFNMPDRLSPFAAGGLNAYCYCEGDPVNYVDPTGRMKRVQSTERRSRLVTLSNGQVMNVSKNMAIAISPKPSTTTFINDPASFAQSKGIKRSLGHTATSPNRLKRSPVDPAAPSSIAPSGQIFTGLHDSVAQPFIPAVASTHSATQPQAPAALASQGSPFQTGSDPITTLSSTASNLLPVVTSNAYPLEGCTQAAGSIRKAGQ